MPFGTLLHAVLAGAVLPARRLARGVRVAARGTGGARGAAVGQPRGAEAARQATSLRRCKLKTSGAIVIAEATNSLNELTKLDLAGCTFARHPQSLFPAAARERAALLVRSLYEIHERHDLDSAGNTNGIAALDFSACVLRFAITRETD